MVSGAEEGGFLWDGSNPVTERQIDAVQTNTFTDFADSVDMAKDSKDRAVISNDGYTVGGANGAAHIYLESGGSWTIEETILAPDAAADSFFGERVAMNGDGSRAVVTQGNTGTPAQRNIFVYERSGTTWSLLDEITTSYTVGTTSGAVLMDSSGDVVVTRNNSTSGEVQIWRWGGASYLLDTTLSNFNSFGTGMGISENGLWLALPRYSLGRMEIWEDTTGSGNWVQRDSFSGVTNTLPRERAAGIVNAGSIVTFGTNVIFESWLWDNVSSYDPITVSLDVGTTILGGGISSDGKVSIAPINDLGKVITLEGDGTTAYVVTSTQAPGNSPFGAPSTAALSYDGRKILVGNDGWNLSNSQQGRAVSFEV
jgi:hypothetical protein